MEESVRDMDRKEKKMGFLERKIYNNLAEAAKFPEYRKAISDENEFQKYMTQLKK